MSEASLIQKVLQNLLANANNPASPSFFPKVVQEHTDLDPQTTPYKGYSSGSWGLGELTGNAGQQAAENICTAVEPFMQTYIPPSSTSFPDINFTNVYLQNLSQVHVDSMTASGPDGHVVINGKLSWGTLTAHGIKGLGIAADFSIVQHCCPTTDDKTCSGAQVKETGTGTIEFVIDQATAIADMPITKLAPNVLTLGLTTVEFDTSPANMNGTVKINDIPHAQAWQSHAETALNSTGTLDQIIVKIRDQVSTPDFKEKVAQAVTQSVDEYLKQSHQYPYGKADLALF